MQPMGGLSMHSWWALFFPFGCEVGGGGFLVFLPCSHHVPKFPMCSPDVFPQDVPNSTWFLSHIVCPKCNSPLNNLKRWSAGVHIWLYFATGGPKSCFYWGHAQCSKIIVDGPINMAPLKIKKKLWLHPWSN
jgi:hypothetical protein